MARINGTVLLFVLIVFATLTDVSAKKKKKKTARLLTFNAQLVNLVPHLDERRAALPEAIKDHDADMVCLQGIWFEDDMKAILDEADQYPYVMSGLHESNGNLPETPAKYAPCDNKIVLFQIVPCITLKCLKYKDDPDAMVKCGIEQCDVYNKVDQQCLSCVLIANLQLQEECVDKQGRKVNIPGLVLMSKYPLNNARMVYFEGDTKVSSKRGYIAAEIPKLGTIVCTHMTYDSNLPYIDQLDYTEYAEQNLAQAQLIVKDMSKQKKLLLAGDLATGPAFPGADIPAELKDTFDYFKSNKYAFSSAMADKCTFCLENPLANTTIVEGYELLNRTNKIIDHILSKKLKLKSVKIVLDEDIDGEDYPLSDHYGVEATMKYKAPKN